LFVIDDLAFEGRSSLERGPRSVLVEGFVAGGREIALACDLIVVARGAKLGRRRRSAQSFLPVAGCSDCLAYELGMVNRLCEPGEALPSALGMAADIAANGPLAVAAIKRILKESVDWPDREFFERQAEFSEPCWPPRTRAKARSHLQRSAFRSGDASRSSAVVATHGTRFFVRRR
jgi:hypothetical protein